MADPRLTTADPPPGWHVPDADIGAYLDDGLDATSAASVEAHLVTCERCRRALALVHARTQGTTTASSWAAIERRLDAPEPSAADRLLAAVGIADHEARMIAPTRSLQGTWIFAIALALGCAAALARVDLGSTTSLPRLLFLTIAPLAPLAAVVAALGTAAEPAPEIALVTPAPRLRISLIRTALALAGSLAVCLAATAALPGSWSTGLAWLAPGLALSGFGALVANRAATTVVAASLGVTWVAGVAVAGIITHDRLAAFRTAPQWGYAAAAVLCAVAIGSRPSLVGQGVES